MYSITNIQVLAWTYDNFVSNRRQLSAACVSKFRHNSSRLLFYSFCASHGTKLHSLKSHSNENTFWKNSTTSSSSLTVWFPWWGQSWEQNNIGWVLASCMYSKNESMQLSFKTNMNYLSFMYTDWLISGLDPEEQISHISLWNNAI